jgi:predicted alpha/beta-hydrolase family hydrolase
VTGRRPVEIEVETPAGTARIDLDRVGGDRLIVLGHGAGGSVDAPDLKAVRECCLAAGISVARMTQPYRLAGRKAPPPAASLDSAWLGAVAMLARRRGLTGHRVVYAGRSAGARVACRTSVQPGLRRPPVAVVALAFPVHPPGKPEKSRLAELDAVTVPTLVVQGKADPFGRPSPASGREVVLVPGDHSLKTSADRVGRLVADWLHALSLD